MRTSTSVPCLGREVLPSIQLPQVLLKFASERLVHLLALKPSAILATAATYPQAYRSTSLSSLLDKVDDAQDVHECGRAKRLLVFQSTNLGSAWACSNPGGKLPALDLQIRFEQQSNMPPRVVHPASHETGALFCGRVLRASGAVGI